MKTKKPMKISINPPPQDGCCISCGRNVKDLKPFGKAGDPLVGDFDGALLVKTFRTMAPRDKKLDKEVDKIKDWDEFFKSNPKKADRLAFYDQIVNTVSASWECRDCIILDDDGYFKTVEEKRRKHETTNNKTK